ncbi:MAG: PstS family phosphate ABC transporter substrate-binding protein [Bacteroidales bacterium]|nr:PstS family phosphate ABC transporter substrate-binding protein [Bacteroidales bacterium]MCF8352063.1 PstS family phosphate ABC transporter substrate-binding protein [Bacteroidales bacterium]MCF8377498.1 PstS family phosphate ABC transporter substrate-binding protein [Bacteroidales bacterium]MCF8401621.1 PstS family phosphate ABC transporter substrate-binding protein [Bacteroidales bacterium]
MRLLQRSFLMGGILGMIIIQFSCGGSSAGKQDEMEGTISISGAFALYPMTVRWAEEFNKVYPDIRIDISAGGAGKGMADALTGMVDLGMFSREVTNVEIDKGAWHIAVAKDAVLPTISDKNPCLKQIKGLGLNRSTFRDIFVNGRLHNWGLLADQCKSGADIHLFTRSDACGAAQMWAQYLGGDQEDLLGIGVYGDPGMADAIKNDPLALGFNNVVYVYDINSRLPYPGLAVAPIDLNDDGLITEDENYYGHLDTLMNAIRKEQYPSPPARELYFVGKGKPQRKVVLTFLEWILTEGQTFLNEAGYVVLPEEKVKRELQRIR